MSYFSKIKKAIRHRLQPHVWQDTGGTLKQRQYQQYEDYLDHQKSKLSKINSDWLAEYDSKYQQALTERLVQDKVVTPAMRVLCLAARIGTEVKSFLRLGCFAIGIDLNPGQDNKYVVTGDFHHLQFADQSVDVIFTNSLDHAFDIQRLILEVARVLTPSGFLILEVMKGEAEGNAGGYRYYESLSWKTVDDLLSHFVQAGFKIIKRSDFSYPDSGEHVVLCRES
jgi:SAM-dependent methyltransferase